MYWFRAFTLVLLVNLTWALVPASVQAGGDGVTHYPQKIARGCRGGRVTAVITSPSKPSGLEVRRDTEDWFRGYDRSLLLSELKRLVRASQ